MRLRAETWLAEIDDAAVGSTVKGRRKEETFQVGWRMLSQLRDGHSVTRLGKATLHVGFVPGGAVDEVLVEGLEEGWRTWGLEVAC